MDKFLLKSLIEKGLSRKEMADELSCSTSTITYWLKKNNLLLPSKKKVHTIPKEDIEKAVKISYSWSELCRNLGKTRTASLHIALRELVDEYQIDVSHFYYPDPRKSPAYRKKPGGMTLTEMLESPTTKSYLLKRKLVNEGIKKNMCEREGCGLSDWLNSPITLELNHIDGNHANNSLDNLEILCPNCHSQTPHHTTEKRLNYGNRQLDTLRWNC